MKIILTAIGSKYIHTALGLRSIRAYAKAHGIEAELIEDTVQTPLLAVLAEITGKEPDVVGLSCIFGIKIMFTALSGFCAK